jgi:hypothetical protein
MDKGIEANLSTFLRFAKPAEGGWRGGLVGVTLGVTVRPTPISRPSDLRSRAS